MKRWIHASNSVISNDIISQAEEFLKPFRGRQVDLENKTMTVPLPKGMTEDDLMSEGMLGRWFEDNGFTVTFSNGDFEYTTQDTWRNYRGWVREKGHKAYLRDRTIMHITW